MPAPGKGPGSASGTGGPGSMGGTGVGSSGGFQGGNGLNNLGKIGSYKKSKRKAGAREEIGAGSATTQTNEMTIDNALKLGANVAAHFAGPIGTLLNAGVTAALDENPFGYENPTGTTDQFSSDPKNLVQSATRPKQKKPKPLINTVPGGAIASPGIKLLAGLPGTLLGT